MWTAGEADEEVGRRQCAGPTRGRRHAECRRRRAAVVAAAGGLPTDPPPTHTLSLPLHTRRTPRSPCQALTRLSQRGVLAPARASPRRSRWCWCWCWCCVVTDALHAPAQPPAPPGPEPQTQTLLSLSLSRALSLSHSLSLTLSHTRSLSHSVRTAARSTPPMARTTQSKTARSGGKRERWREGGRQRP
eukprot:1653280-Rhodomonas_salina.1